MLRIYQIWFWIGSRLWPRSAAKQAFDLFITPQKRVSKPLPPIFLAADLLEWNESGDCCKGWRWNKGGKLRILILHGFSSSARNFAHLVETLTQHGAEVVAFDAPVHGSSEGKRIHSLRYSKFIQAIREKWGPFDEYKAHSFGGLSLSLALEEKQPRSQERVVLIAPATETRSTLKQLQSTLLLSDRLMGHINRIIEKRSGHPTSWFSVNRAISGLPNPILWVHDRSDEVTPIEDTWPTQNRSAQTVFFRITDGLGHRRVYRDPSVCEEVIQFLTTSYLPK